MPGITHEKGKRLQWVDLGCQVATKAAVTLPLLTLMEGKKI